LPTSATLVTAPCIALAGRRAGGHAYNPRMSEPAAWSTRWLAWSLPLILVVYLVATQGNGYLDLPYWFCLGAPATALFGPWLIFAAVRGDARCGPTPRVARGLVGVSSSFGLAAIGLAIGLRLIHLETIRTVILVAFVAVGVALAGVGAVAGWRSRAGPRPVQVLLMLALATMVDADLRTIAYAFLKDFGIYLRAGHNFLDGHAVYVMGTTAGYLRDPTLYPFVYPPAAIPVFAGLAALPVAVAKALWLAMCLGVSVAAVRIIGVRWRWLPVILLWTPFIQGLYVGNAAVPAFALFAAAPALGALLALPPVFKVQLGIPGLWLVRERRWRDLALAVAIGLALIVATLPFVGLSSWSAWLRQLADFSNQVHANPGMMGLSLTFWLGPLVAGAVGVAVVVAALTRRRGDGLAALGVASLAVSPTLYAEGATMALPALLRLRAPYLWFALALTSTLGSTAGYWVGLAIGFAALWFPALRHAEALDQLHHPLGLEPQAWPGFQTRSDEMVGSRR